MRDPDRIPEVLQQLHQIWLYDPDLRFNQLVFNLQSLFSAENDGVGRVEEVTGDGLVKTGFDLFSIEDRRFLRFLRSHLAGLRAAANS